MKAQIVLKVAFVAMALFVCRGEAWACDGDDAQCQCDEVCRVNSKGLYWCAPLITGDRNGQACYTGTGQLGICGGSTCCADCAYNRLCKANGAVCSSSLNLVCNNDSCDLGCGIGGVYRAPDAVNPSNPCQTCQPSVTETAWSPAFEAQPKTCGAGTVCHSGACTAGCGIAGVYYASGAVNPSNPCQTCQPSVSRTAWTNAFQGQTSTCGTAQVCNAGACTTGCGISNTYYASGTVNPSNPCQTCQPSVNRTGWTNAFQAQPSTCAAGQVCNAGACTTGCGISSTYYASGAVNPSNPCQTCQPAVSRTAWSSAYEALPQTCSAGKVCHSGACSDGCGIGGIFYTPNTFNGGCQACVPATSRTSWTNVNEAAQSTCPGGQYCHTGACTSGCSIDGTFYASGYVDPNTCRKCDPAANSAAWTYINQGNACGAGGGLICYNGACQTGCLISSTFYATNASNGACQTCQPSVRTNDWTNANELLASTCPGGQICHLGACQSGCGIGGSFYAPSATNGSCQVCNPTASTSLWTNTNEAQQSTCGAGTVCHSGACASGCGIGGIYYAADTLSGACQACKPSLSVTTWSNTNEALASTCGAGNVCHTGSCTAGCGIAGTYYATGATNGSCQVCDPAADRTAWTNTNEALASTCSAGKVCHTGACTDGCGIGGTYYATDAPNGSCQACKPSVTVSAWTFTGEATASSCAAGKVCHDGACTDGCGIGGNYVAPDTANGSCQACKPATSRTAWSDVNEAAVSTCSTGTVCHNGACTAGCGIAGSYYASGATNGGCRSCLPASSVTAWTSINEAAKSTCAAQEVCHDGACTTGCGISGTYYAAAATNGTCLVCTPAASTSAWTPTNETQQCDPVSHPTFTCSGGICGENCVIGGTPYPPGAKHPTNPCLACVPQTSTTDWSPANEASATATAGDSSTCAAGKVCHAGACTDGCGITGTYYATSAPNPTNPCLSCQPGTSRTDWSLANEALQSTCAAGTVCHLGACTAGCGISGSYYTSGAVKSDNPCLSCQPAAAVDLWTNTSEALPVSCGAGMVCHLGACTTGCGISSTYYAADATNGSCQSCQPATSRTSWTNATDGGSCGAAVICSGGSCQSGCYISGQFQAAGATNPSNVCQICAPATNTGAWSPGNNGTACAAGAVCVGGSCQNGCFIEGVQYAAGATNSGNSCQYCDPGTSTTAWATRADAYACEAGKVCRTGSCTAGCFVAGSYYTSGSEDPGSACRACIPGTSTTAFSSWHEGDGCAAGMVCKSGACSEGCYISSTHYLSGASNPSNSCQTCAPAASTSLWTNGSDGTACDAGKVCRTGTCTSGCWIGGAYYASGDVNPGNSCQICTPGTSTTAWSSTNENGACAAGKVCRAGACTSGCVISGSYYAADFTNPGNTCQACKPLLTTTAWSGGNEGASCGAGKVCNSGTCADGCFVDASFRMPGAQNPGNVCQACAPATSTTAWSGGNEGGACDTAKICHAGACSSGCQITGTYHDADTQKPGDVCQACVPATSTSAWSPANSGASCGTGMLCSAGTCREICVIAGTTYAKDTANPANPCQSCQPAVSTSGWSTLVAAEGTVCGTGKVCKSGACADGCYIASAHYASGATNPANACEGCNPTASPIAWSAANESSACATGKLCSGGQCLAVCAISGTTYAANAPNPANACEACLPATSNIDWTATGEGQGCASGKVCHSGLCASGCFIASAYYGAGTISPSDVCQVCNPAASTTSWSGGNKGAACAPGKVCSAGQCLPSCNIDGDVVASGAANPLNPCQSCQPGTNTTAWTNSFEGSGCGAGKVCHTGACSDGCYIASTYYASGTLHPTELCQACDPAQSTSAWSGGNDGAACATGKICSAGLCQSACWIGGQAYGSGAANPANACQSCQPATSTTAWSNRTEGTGCAGGTKVCHSGACSDGCFIGGSYYASLTTNLLNLCQVCLPSTSTADWSDNQDGTSCETGKVCNAGTCADGCYVAGASYAPNAANPANVCQACKPAQATDAWSSGADGAGCAAGKVCRTGQCRDGCFIDSTFRAPSALNPANACQLCKADASTTAWSNAADGVSCGTDKACKAGTCVDQCTIGGTAYADGAANPANPCEYCSAAAKPGDWSYKGDNFACGAAARYCQTTATGAHACQEGCLIAGAFYAPGAAQGALDDQSCHVCDPARSASDFSLADKGARCGTDNNDCTDDTCDEAALCTHPKAANGKTCGEGAVDATATTFCFEGACEQGCRINDIPYRDDTPNPANRCQVCKPSKKTSDWSAATVGLDCRDPATPANPCMAYECDAAGACQAKPVHVGDQCGNNGEVCASSGYCTCSHGVAETDCKDGVDNDCNGKVDCADDACASKACVTSDRCVLAGTEKCAAGACAGDLRDCSQPTLACRLPGTCRKADGECDFPIAAAGTACVNEQGCPGVCTDTGACDGVCDKAAASPTMFSCGCTSAAGAAPLALALLALVALRRRRSRAGIAALVGAAVLLAAPEARAADAKPAAAPAKKAAPKAAPKAPAKPEATAPKAEEPALAPPPPPAPEPATKTIEATAVPAAPAAQPAAAAAPKKPKRVKVAVLGLKPGAAEEAKMASLLSDLLTDRASRRPELSIVSTKDIEASLGLEKQKQLLGCSDNSCMAEIGGALGVDKLLSGTLNKVGSSFVVSVVLIDAKTSVPQRRFSAQARNATEEEALKLVPPVVEALFGDQEPSQEMYVSEGESSLAPTKAPTVAVKLRGQVQAAGELAAAGAVLVGWQPVGPLRVSLGGLFAKTRQGMLLNVSWIPFNSDGRIYPLVGLEAPVFFNSPIAAGVGLNVGLEYAPIKYFAIGFEVPAYYFLTAPEGKDRLYVFGALTATARF